MKINTKSESVPTREQRLGSITGYVGDLNDLVAKSQTGVLQNRDRCFSQSSMCLQACAVGNIAGIRDIAIIYHSPAGCSVFTNVLGIQLAKNINAIYNTVVVGSDLDEADTVFGAVDGIREIARKIRKQYNPKALFIASSCLSGVIGEDIDAIVEEIENDFNHEIPVGALHCEGFKSRIWASGFDISDHAILKHLVKPPKEKRNVINFKNFFESERRSITDLFARLGVETLFLYANTTAEELEHLSESLATVCICGTLGTYLGNALEELYGVPYIRSINPMGMAGFDTWMREIGKVIGKQDEVDKIIAEEREKYLPQIEAIKKEIKGLRTVVGMGPGYTYEVSRVIQELGMTVEWAAAWHFDYKYDNGEIPPSLEYLKNTSPNNIGLSVADQQNFEVLNILNTVKPDIYFSRHPGTTVWAIKQGYSAVFVADEYMIFGYKGTLNFAKAILDAIRNRSFEKNLAARTKLPYTDWWYKQNSQAMMTPVSGTEGG
jgi:nitrogenase molybdenum-iron protein alpha chain